MKVPCVYLMASHRNGTLYCGVTSGLVQRVWTHKNNLVAGFTKEHHVHLLVWYEVHASMIEAIRREKAIKEWNRGWKIALVTSGNPAWRDLYADICR